ncbi:hypothetical protein [Roseibium litorale]|uniref:Uncharacterized protein n=1 Tax=Roseibium litorale TaxID=2803841 RepID=A0ABR9CKG2_9HYPH|nr:hypothetical protein [Roseibium litorale]
MLHNSPQQSAAKVSDQALALPAAMNGMPIMERLFQGIESKGGMPCTACPQAGNTPGKCVDERVIEGVIG